MYINATGYYIPTERVDNAHFFPINGLTDEWIVKRTGIHTRSRAGENEGQNSMALAAVADAAKSLPYDIKDVDLIVSAAYSAYDTVATVAHETQKAFEIDGAKALYRYTNDRRFLYLPDIQSAAQSWLPDMIGQYQKSKEAWNELTERWFGR